MTDQQTTTGQPTSADTRVVVAIDGPSGSGKSTVSRGLAQRLGLRYLDTGAMYRALTWAVLQSAVDPTDTDHVREVLGRTSLESGTDPAHPQISANGERVDEPIRGRAVTSSVSIVSAVPEVRRALIAQQRSIIGVGGIVVEGRDIGAVVAPDADLKVFLTADAGARAGRRSTERRADSTATAADLARRDTADNKTSPLTAADGAVTLDTTDLSIEAVIDRLAALLAEAITR